MIGGKTVIASVFIFVGVVALSPANVRGDDLLSIENDVLKIAIDREKGGAITFLSWKDYPRNVVNLADPGRLIQQSYYAGRSRNRIAEGQHEAWSPWAWNPIQGGGVGPVGGVGSWARVTDSSANDETLYSETIPQLWDMPNEAAAAVMRQWTTFEPAMVNVIVVRCELVCKRSAGDTWGEATPRHQEIPAFYFTRNFATVKCYLGAGLWREEAQVPGPPWGRAAPPLKAMALFDEGGQGIAVFSPSSRSPWNFGPHGSGLTDDPASGPCMHVAPLDIVALSPRSTYRYRYWIVVGNSAQVSKSLDALWEKYRSDTSQLIDR